MKNDPQVLIMLPDNGRKASHPIPISMHGDQVGTVRIFQLRDVSGKKLPDYTRAMSKAEHRAMMNGIGRVEPHYFHGVFYEGKKR